MHCGSRPAASLLLGGHEPGCEVVDPVGAHEGAIGALDVVVTGSGVGDRLQDGPVVCEQLLQASHGGGGAAISGLPSSASLASARAAPHFFKQIE